MSKNAVHMNTPCPSLLSLPLGFPLDTLPTLFFCIYPALPCLSCRPPLTHSPVLSLPAGHQRGAESGAQPASFAAGGQAPIQAIKGAPALYNPAPLLPCTVSHLYCSYVAHDFQPTLYFSACRPMHCVARGNRQLCCTHSSHSSCKRWCAVVPMHPCTHSFPHLALCVVSAPLTGQLPGCIVQVG